MVDVLGTVFELGPLSYLIVPSPTDPFGLACRRYDIMLVLAALCAMIYHTAINEVGTPQTNACNMLMSALQCFPILHLPTILHTYELTRRHW